MGLIDKAVETVVALIIIIFTFWVAIPEIAKITGANIWYIKPLGFILVGIVILGAIYRIWRWFSG